MTSESDLKALASARTRDSIEFCGLYRTQDPSAMLRQAGGSILGVSQGVARRLSGRAGTVMLALSADNLYLFRASSHLGGWRIGFELARMRRQPGACQPLNGEPFAFRVTFPDIESAVSLYPLSVTVETRQIRRLLCPRSEGTTTG